MFHLLVPMAHAQYTDCAIRLADTVPADGQVNVPLDAVPQAVFSGSWDCLEAEEWTIEVVDASSGVLIATASFDGADVADLRWIGLEHEDRFLPDTEHLLRVFSDPRAEGAPDPVETHFVTGQGLVEGLFGQPEITELDAMFNDSSGEYTASFAISPAADADSLSIVQVVGDSFRVVGHPTPCDSMPVVGEAQLEGSCTSFGSWAPEETCVRIRQIDGVGTRTDWSADACAEVPGGCAGCGQVGAIAVSRCVHFVILSLALLGTRRTRRMRLLRTPAPAG